MRDITKNFAFWAVHTPTGKVLALFQLLNEAYAYLDRSVEAVHDKPRRVHHDGLLAGKNETYILPVLAHNPLPAVLRTLPDDSLEQLSRYIHDEFWHRELERDAFTAEEFELDFQKHAWRLEAIEAECRARDKSPVEDPTLLAPVPDEN